MRYVLFTLTAFAILPGLAVGEPVDEMPISWGPCYETASTRNVTKPEEACRYSVYCEGTRVEQGLQGLCAKVETYKVTTRVCPGNPETKTELSSILVSTSLQTPALSDEYNAELCETRLDQASTTAPGTDGTAPLGDADFRRLCRDNCYAIDRGAPNPETLQACLLSCDRPRTTTDD